MTRPTDRLFIDGAFRQAGKTIPVVEAATGEVFADGPCATPSDIDAAVAAAHESPAVRWGGKHRRQNGRRCSSDTPPRCDRARRTPRGWSAGRTGCRSRCRGR